MIKYKTLPNGNISGNGFHEIPVTHPLYQDAQNLISSGEADITPLVPISVTMRQARRALNTAGLLQKAIDAISALPDPPRSNAMIDFEYASEVERGSEFTQSIADLLLLTDVEVDNLFISASQL